MRRHDRDASNPDQIEQILAACDIGRLGLVDDGVPYLVPLHFVFARAAGAFTVYFHGAGEGLKLDLIGAGAPAGFETDRRLAPLNSTNPCRTTAHYESVIGRGWVDVCHDPAEKRRALTLVTRKYTPNLTPDFTDVAVAAVTVLRLALTQVTGKRNPPPG